MNKIKYKLWMLSFFTMITGFSQDSFTGNLFVHSENTGGGIALFKNKVFTANEVISTEQLNKGDACIVFAESSSWESETETGYVDGFVLSKQETFVFPVGGNGKRMPVKASNAKNLKVAYITNDSSFDLPNEGASVQLLNNSEYWVVQGKEPTNLSFLWKNISVQDLNITDINELKVIGFKDSKWELLPSSVDSNLFNGTDSKGNLLNETSTLQKGAVSTSNLVVPNDYLAFSIGIVSNSLNNRLTENKEKSSLDLTNYTKIKSIHFPFKEFNVTRYSTNLLEKLSSTLKDKNVKIKLIGHTDGFGSSNYNHSLGEKRAASVKSMLESYGVHFIEVEVISKGKKEAKYDCEQLDCNSRETIEDRRVDIYILDK
ncbi:OmpA family protein [Pseudofulvibacter geojedonensis]|uniref:OmpA family protein n=1 Tax=Pseudofulvibacter geojedonensis TaxID=1123758 RepID=A0ABW3I009_9FLAO